MKRWLKTAKFDPSDKHESQISPDVISMARFSALSFKCSQMCFFGSRTKKGFEELKVEMPHGRTLQFKYKCKWRSDT